MTTINSSNYQPATTGGTSSAPPSNPATETPTDHSKPKETKPFQAGDASAALAKADKNDNNQLLSWVAGIFNKDAIPGSDEAVKGGRDTTSIG